MLHKQIVLAFIFIACFSLISTCDGQQKPDTGWIKAYYNALKQSEDGFRIEVMLADLNFDGTPEILLCDYSDGTYYYDNGFTVQDGKALRLTDLSFYVSQLVGTIKAADGRTLWYGRYYWAAPHRWPDTAQMMYIYSVKSLYK